MHKPTWTAQYSSQRGHHVPVTQIKIQDPTSPQKPSSWSFFSITTYPSPREPQA